jgi:hypothetical protein
MSMRSSVCWVPTRLQSILSIPQLLLDGVTVTRVAMDRMERVSAYQWRVQMRVHLLPWVLQYWLGLPLNLIPLLLQVLSFLLMHL